MRLRIRVRDFQAIGSADLMVDGITFLTGSNNQGKTAIIRAFKAACCGRAGDDFIRHGTKKCMVGLEFSDFADGPATEIAWVKPDGKGASFVIDGKTFDKLGRQFCPVDELEAVGLRQLECAGSKSLILVWDQREQPFMVKLPPTQAFELVSKVMEERQVLPVMDEMKRDLKDLRDKAISHEGVVAAKRQDLQDLKARLDHQAPILDLETEVDAVSKVSIEVTDLEARLGVVTSLVNRAGQVRREARKILDSFNHIASLSKSAKARISQYELLVKYYLVRKIRKELTRDKAQSASLICAKDAQVLLAEVDRLTDALSDIRRAKSRIESLSPDLSRTRNSVESLNPGNLTEELSDLKEAYSDYFKVTHLVENIRKLKAEHSNTAKNLITYEADVETLKDELGICPLCGADLKGKTL